MHMIFHEAVKTNSVLHDSMTTGSVVIIRPGYNFYIFGLVHVCWITVIQGSDLHHVLLFPARDPLDPGF